MEHALSSGARAALAKIEEDRQLQDSKRRLRDVLQHNAEYLSSNSLIVFVGEEKPSEALLEAERNGDAKASLQRSRDWIQNGWLRAAQLIEELGLSQIVKNLAPPQVPWMDMHDLFVTVLLAGKQKTERERCARKLCAIRMVLGNGRYVLGRYFGWLKDQVDAHWSRSAGCPAPAAAISSPKDVGEELPTTLSEYMQSRNLPRPIQVGRYWWRAPRAAVQEAVKTSTLSNYRHGGRKTADSQAGEDSMGRVWVKLGTNAQVFYLRSSLRSAQGQP